MFLRIRKSFSNGETGLSNIKRAQKGVGLHWKSPLKDTIFGLRGSEKVRPVGVVEGGRNVDDFETQLVHLLSDKVFVGKMRDVKLVTRDLGNIGQR